MPFCSITLTAQKPAKPPTILNTIGDHIKRRRLELGLFQKDVAQILGVDESTVTNWEKNRTTPMLWALPKIIEFLDYDPSFGDPSTLGGRLLRYRKYQGMTQKELSKQIGIDPSTIGRLEKNRGECLPSVLEKVGAFLLSIFHDSNKRL
ncbi:MAG: helix-turn-helix transcriptional regulator [Ignavibacteria bacterium]|nr:helix-turn-helix transcriptional regulator [Ignavibacteria bacterium]